VKRTILYVEDDTNDAVLVRRVLENEKLDAKIFVLPDGIDAADWVVGRGIYRDRTKYPEPDVMIVDLRMPRHSGFDLLEFAQARRELKKIAIVVYTNSEDPHDKAKAFRFGANAFINKGPKGLKDLIEYVKLIIATLPPPVE
jgi:CheY-like chemotaxis protein